MVELKYKIVEISYGVRAFKIEKRMLKTFAFKHRVGGKLQRAKFNDIGKDYLLITKGQILAFRKPHYRTYHNYMRAHNVRQRWLGETLKDDKIVTDYDLVMENMLELEQII